MKYTLQEARALQRPLSGIYKIDFPNGKSYIGLSNNMLKRMYSHNEKDYALNRLVGNAINYYGPITEFEVLEEISPDNRELMNEREKYWIALYHTWIGDPQCNGYNATQGGDGGVILPGVENPNASLNKEQLENIIFLLQNHKEISMIDIATKFGVCTEVIYGINRGIRYIQPDIVYPIRKQEESNKALLSGVKSSSAKLNKDNIEKVFDDIINSSLTFIQIGEKYNISNSTVGLINKGKRYYNENYVYPLRNDKRKKEIQYKK